MCYLSGHGFVCAYDPADLGSNPRHTIYALKNYKIFEHF